MNWTGLAALVWDPSGGDEAQEDHDFIKRVIEQNDGPALDVGCGTGRLLLRYLAAGLDVDGVDTSADMLAICRQKAGERGLPEPRLYQQGMQALELARRYQTIYIPCGSFVLLTDRNDAWEALRRFYAHLEPGGMLVFNVFWPFTPGEPLSDNPNGSDGEWGSLFDHTLPDGRVMKQHVKREKIDRVEQLLLAKRRYQLYEEDQLVAEEVFDSNERWYFKQEMILMLEKVGFKDIEVKGNWSEEDFAEPHYSMVFVARK
jgi:ubiquinone/menaquinone biosynthesis C-methylase UbiE